MKNQAIEKLEQAKLAYQAEIEDSLLAIEQEREIQAFDKAFTSGKPALPQTFFIKKKRGGKKSDNSLFLESNVKTFDEAVQWLRNRTNEKYYETWFQNQCISDYIENMYNFLSEPRTAAEIIAKQASEKALANHKFASTGASYKVFSNSGKPNKWFTTNLSALFGEFFENCLFSVPKEIL